MAKQLGTVLVFKPGVSQKQAEDAVKKLLSDGLLDPDYGSYYRYTPHSPDYPHDAPSINSFDRDVEGGPVWYIP